MDPGRFDRLSKRFAVRGLSRRQTLRGLGAAGLAGALVGLRREQAAADCPDITDCYRPCGAEQGVCISGFDPHFYIPGGPYGTCWDWNSFTCKPCASGVTWESLHAVCNASHSRCYGECKASFYIP